MAEHIEREAAFDAVFGQFCASSDETEQVLNAAIEEIKTIPAADAVEVVRCGQCKYGKYTGTEWFCDKHSGHVDVFGEDASYHEYHSKYFFCSDGERRNDG